MSSIGNNLSGEIAHLRDCFFDSGERKYFNQLLKDPGEQKIHQILIKKDANFLYEKAQNLINKVENGEIDDIYMGDVEYKIVHLLGAIEDIERDLQLERSTKVVDKYHQVDSPVYSKNNRQKNKELEKEMEMTR